MKAIWIGVAAFGLTAATPSLAAENVMKACGAKYQAAKAANKLPAGQTWNQFLAQCRTQMVPAASVTPAKPTMAAGAKPSAAPAAPATRTSTAGRAPTSGQQAAHDRQRACGAQWSAAKAAGKIPAGQKWPQYWSQCNARMK